MAESKAKNFLACYCYLIRKPDKPTNMKQVLQKILRAEDANEQSGILPTVLMILLFLTFWGASFYVLLSSFA